MIKLGGVGNMPCKVLELYLMDACLSIFGLINLGEALSLNVIKIKRPIATEQRYVQLVVECYVKS